jgi:hypothetical protein
VIRTITTLLFLFPGAAQAQEEVCSGDFTHANWAGAMDQADEVLASFKIDAVKALLKETQKKVPCLDAIAKPSHLGRFARQHALVAFYEQDEITATRWGMLQRYAAPDMPWPEDIGEDHPLREILDFADEPTLAGPSDKGLVFPKKGAVFMNGRLLTEPKARAEIPNLIQVAEKSGDITTQYWQDGAAFKDDLLGEPGAVPEMPKWFIPEDDGGSDAVASVEASSDNPEKPEKIDRPKPEKGPSSGPKVANLAASAAMAVVAGTLYGVGGASHGGLKSATSESELASVRSRTNILAMSSGVAIAGAIGVGVTAFVDADGGGMGFQFRF